MTVKEIDGGKKRICAKCDQTIEPCPETCSFGWIHTESGLHYCSELNLKNFPKATPKTEDEDGGVQ